jgi:hypothetical protein
MAFPSNLTHSEHSNQLDRQGGYLCYSESRWGGIRTESRWDYDIGAVRKEQKNK